MGKIAGSFKDRNELRYIQHYRQKYTRYGLSPQHTTLMGIKAASKSRQSCVYSHDELWNRFDGQYWQFRRDYHSQVTLIKGPAFWVTRAIHRDEVVAIKHLGFAWDDLARPRKEFLARLQHEYTILRSLQHDNIIKALDLVVTKKESFLILPLMQGQDLFYRLGQYDHHIMPENEAKMILWQILQATQYLHHHNIIHRDIKLENVLLARPNSLSLVLCDFESSTYIQPEQELDEFRVGTLINRAPEIINELSYSFPVDCWCIGIIMYELLLGHPPFFIDRIGNRQSTMKRSHWMVLLAKTCGELLGKLLMIDPARRMKASQALQHPWFEQVANGDLKLE